jgi:peptidylprolyl isomerase
MRRFLLPLVGAFLMTANIAASADDFTTLPSGVKYHDEVVGTGPEPQSGQTVVVQYTGWLDNNGQKGRKFDSSRDRSQPFSFILNDQQVIPGWDAGVATMHVGGKRTLIIPPDQAYGDQGAGGVIPPGATLIFDIELLGAN